MIGSSSFCWRACQKSGGQYCPPLDLIIIQFSFNTAIFFFKYGRVEGSISFCLLPSPFSNPGNTHSPPPSQPNPREILTHIMHWINHNFILTLLSKILLYSSKQLLHNVCFGLRTFSLFVYMFWSFRGFTCAITGFLGKGEGNRQSRGDLGGGGI